MKSQSDFPKKASVLTFLTIMLSISKKCEKNRDDKKINFSKNYLKIMSIVNVLSGDNKVDVDITPDLQNIRVQICSCSIIFNCFSKP